MHRKRLHVPRGFGSGLRITKFTFLESFSQTLTILIFGGTTLCILYRSCRWTSDIKKLSLDIRHHVVMSRIPIRDEVESQNNYRAWWQAKAWTRTIVRRRPHRHTFLFTETEQATDARQSTANRKPHLSVVPPTETSPRVIRWTEHSTPVHSYRKSGTSRTDKLTCRKQEHKQHTCFTSERKTPIWRSIKTRSLNLAMR